MQINKIYVWVYLWIQSFICTQLASARHSADGKRTKEAAANLKEKKDLEDKISGKTEMVTLLQKSLLLKEDRLLEVQVTCNF